jgi:hypothetical protein
LKFATIFWLSQRCLAHAHICSISKTEWVYMTCTKGYERYALLVVHNQYIHDYMWSGRFWKISNVCLWEWELEATGVRIRTSWGKGPNAAASWCKTTCQQHVLSEEHQNKMRAPPWAGAKMQSSKAVFHIGKTRCWMGALE